MVLSPKGAVYSLLQFVPVEGRGSRFCMLACRLMVSQWCIKRAVEKLLSCSTNDHISNFSMSDKLEGVESPAFYVNSTISHLAAYSIFIAATIY